MPSWRRASRINNDNDSAILKALASESPRRKLAMSSAFVDDFLPPTYSVMLHI